MPTPIGSRFTRTGDPYLVEDFDVRGGYRSVADLTERNAIPLTARRVGMTVYCIADTTEYQLQGTISNNSWKIRPLFSGKSHVVNAVIKVGVLSQFDPSTFEQYAAQSLVEWFNSLPAENRVLNVPICYFKFMYCVGTPTTMVGSVPPNGTTYVGDATFVYDDFPLATSVYLNVNNVVCISKSLIPLGDSVINAMNEYAERMEAAE